MDANTDANMDDDLTLLKIRALVILAVALLVIQVLFGSYRRRSSSSFVKCSLWAAFAIPGLLVPYAIGLMHATEIQNKLFVVWATFLIIVFGSSSTMSAYQLDDNERWRIMKFVQLVQIFWAWWLWSIYARDLASKGYVHSVVYATPLAILLILSTLKLSDRFRASQLASLSYGARSDNKIVADYMKDYMQSEHEQETNYDPVTMKGYRYLVAGEDLNIAEPKPPHYRMMIEKMDRVITVEKIWQCHGRLLQGPHGNKLKDVCLSFALYKLLRRRYVRYELSEAPHKNTRRFVLDGLLSGENAAERAFRVIEVELAFFYDSFFTKYPVIFSKWIRMFIKSCLLMLVCLWAVIVIFLQYSVENEGEVRSLGKSIHESEDNVFFDVVLTYAVVLSISAAEYWQVVAYALSDWAKVLVVWTYIRFPILQTILQRFYYLNLILSILCRLRLLKPWKRKLGQYSLLYSFHRNPNPLVVMIKWLLLLEKTRNGQRGNREIKLSSAVKKAVAASLKANEENLRKGSSSLARNEVLDEFRWVFRIYHTHSHAILVWHIATEICMLAKEANEQNPWRPSHLLSFRRRFMYEADDMQVANNLSCYCAYLVAFFPEFLPEYKYINVIVFDEVVKHARGSLKGFKKMSKREKYLKLSVDYNIDAEEEGESVLGYGVKLGRELMVKIEDENKRWKVLADFWAEMVLYLALSDDTRTHVEHLTRGGEFITHLWALLTHAGILQRQSGPDPV